MKQKIDNKQIFEKIYSLSPMQEGMLFHSLMDKESEAYFEQTVFSINGSLDLVLLEKSLNLLIERYDVFRTIFFYKGLQKPKQVVLKERRAEIYFEDISQADENEKLFYIEKFKRKDRSRGFDLMKDILIRISVIKTSNKVYRAIWSFHHILMDGWCTGITINEFFNIYKSLKEGKPLNMGAVFPYSNYIKWLEKQHKEEAVLYWRDYLEGYEIPATLPKHGHVLEKKGYKQEEISFIISEESTKGLETIARENRVTLNTVFQSIWGILLQRYNNTSDVVFGSVVSGRQHDVADIDKMIGLFINTIPVRINCDKFQSFSGLIRQVQESSLSFMKYDYLPLYEIQSNSELKQDLMDHIIAFENYPIEKVIQNSSDKDQGIEFTINDVEIFYQSNYDLGIIVIPGNELVVKLNYNATVFDRDFLKKTEGHFKEMVKIVMETPNILIREIDILTKAEEMQILYEFNDTKVEYSGNKTIQKMFEEQVEKTPGNIAVVFEDRELTYRELNEKSNQIARLLKNKGLNTGDIVGLMVERSLEMIVGMLGILKAGGAYLPIDPEYPGERISFMLDDCNTNILLTQHHLMEKIEYAGELIDIEDWDLYCGEGTNLVKTSNPDAPAYIIYTSGTVGKPKGVIVEHRSISNTIQWRREEYGLSVADNVLQLFSFSFDGFLTSFFTPITCGSKVVLLNEEEAKNPVLIKSRIVTGKITHFISVPALYRAIMESMEAEEMKTLKVVTLAGEKVPVELVKISKRKNKDLEVVNEYGPTEGSVAATIQRDMQEGTNKIIGKPIANTQIYILDKNKRLQSVGIAGELCIAGIGVARGYLNRKELTTEKFVSNPFIPGERMYRTGDIARWLPDGNIEFLGRIDQQVKIRGYRIELEEIESLLLKYGLIKEAVVTVCGETDVNKNLCAYIVSDVKLKESELRNYLSTKLPDYMIPSVFIQLERIPLTPNGKTDVKALPEFDGSVNISEEYTAPRNVIEKQIADICQDVLGVERVGIDDNFFKLGANSINIMLMISKIYEKLYLEISPKQMYETPTIRRMSAPDKKGVFLYEYENVERIEAILINGKKEKSMFAFPPAGFRAEYYNNLGGHINLFSLYGLNFIYPKNYIQLWVDLIMNLQKGEPCVLFGHSGGGSLAYEVGKELTNRGQFVSDLIILDASIKINLSIYDQEGGKENFTKTMCRIIHNHFEKEKEMKINTKNEDTNNIRLDEKKQIDSYPEFLDIMKKHGTIDADIHLITNNALNTMTDFLNEEIELWRKSTVKTVKQYDGYGSHADMIFPPYLGKNALIINEILKNIE